MKLLFRRNRTIAEDTPKSSRVTRAKQKREAKRVAEQVRSTAEPAAPLLRLYTQPGSRRTQIVLLVALTLFCFLYGMGFALFGRFLIVQFMFPIALLGAITIWALPELGRAPTKALDRLFFAFFLAVPLWPNYLAIALPGAPWITVVRLTGIPLTLVLLICVSISKSFRSDLGRILSATPAMWRLLAAFAIYQLGSVFLSSSPQFSANKLVIAQISWTAIYFVSVFVFYKPRRAQIWALMVWAAAIWLSLLVIWEARLGQVPWAGHIPSFLAVDDPSVQRALSGGARAGTGQYRVHGTYSSSLGLAEFMALSTPFVVHQIAANRHLIIRLMALASLPVILNAVILTDSRLGMIGFMLSIILYMAFWAMLRWRQHKQSIFGPAVVLAYPALMGILLVASLTVPRIRGMTWGGGKQQASTDARLEQFQKGIPMVIKNPIGHGIGRGAEQLGFVNPGGTLTIDTYYLLIALEYGVVGFILFYGLFCLAIYHSALGIIRGPTNSDHELLMPAGIAMMNFFIIKSIYSGIENQSIAFMILGMITALFCRLASDKTPLTETDRSASR